MANRTAEAGEQGRRRDWMVDGVDRTCPIFDAAYHAAVECLYRARLVGPDLQSACKTAFDASESPWSQWGAATGATRDECFRHYAGVAKAADAALLSCRLVTREGTQFRLASSCMLEAGSGFVWSTYRRREELGMSSITYRRFAAPYAALRDAILIAVQIRSSEL